ncbi:DCMP deaminase [Colletotrichum truncatum]|uniref:dCMP deaminase n=1 Tax=Colletotrichum truncatum TaxID=5467 RepID=A0ACC3ZDQ9_COLTU|nr:DCMP deaminase [Colletotrichum truncatum]KAF6794845.1 DCMP deaminase [Colletotrichum truncatum]
MLIGICGGICAGKKTVAQYLVEHHGFKLLRLTAPSEISIRNETSHNGAVQDKTPDSATPGDTNVGAPVLAASSMPSVAPSVSGDTDAGAQKQPGKKGKKKKNKCFYCDGVGHTKKDCPIANAPFVLGVTMPVRGPPPPPSTSGTSVRGPLPPPSVSGASVSAAAAATATEVTFSSADALLEYVTTRWQSRFVMTDVHTEAILDQLSRRPFFMLISVDAPLTVRHARYRALHNPHCTLESFALTSDAHLYDPFDGLQPLISRATVRLLNTSSSLAHLYATLGKLKLADPVRLRPSWDAYFMSLATLASLRSNCMKRRVGAVLVGREKRVISTGYNGTPRGLQNCSDGGCSRCNSGNSSGVGLATCLCIHAEENALLEAGRERIREGAVLYCDTCPCLTCSIKICQVGIDEVVYAQGYSMDTETAAVFRQAGVKLRQYIPPPNGLIHLENLEKVELY